MRVPYSGEKQVEANGITIAYDAFGSPELPPLLLVAGLGMQSIGWDEDFCQQLAQKGYWVIRFDNRDVGRSTRFDKAGMPDPNKIAVAVMTKQPLAESAYLLKDMAADAVGLLDALGIEQAYVVGVSLGGMILQEMLIHFGDRVKTAVSIMSNTGNPELPMPTPEALALLMQSSPTDREEYIEQSVQSWRVLQGDHFPFLEERVRQKASRIFERGLSPAGTARQFAAGLASGSRVEALKSVTTPTLVIHGDADPLIPVEGGYETAESISNAKLLIIEGMGHSLPIETWPQIVAAIADHAQ
jgi:pimeloyl-ACP methyl ester carboxylesterase